MFNFDEVHCRLNTGSMKWDGGAKRLTDAHHAMNPLPMWVADMDFKTAPEVIQALEREVAHGIFGYSEATQGYIEAVIGWQSRRFGWTPKAEWLVQSPGIVNALNMAIQAFSVPGESIVVQAPVYIHFHQDVVTNGRRVIEVPLALNDGRYSFDAEAFEAAIRPDTRLFILCNPHNPTGNLWSREDLSTMASICARHDIIVIADEIHQDFVFGDGAAYYPYALLGQDALDNAIVCTAPSKTFNLAGLQCSNLFISNPRLRQRYKAHADRCGLNLVNKLGMVACEAAYRHGDTWVDEMVSYVGVNQRRFHESIDNLAALVKVTPTPSLYLAWIDFRGLGMAPTELHDFLVRKAGLWLDSGLKFGKGGGGHMRINLACARSVVETAISRLQAAIQ